MRISCDIKYRFNIRFIRTTPFEDLCMQRLRHMVTMRYCLMLCGEFELILINLDFLRIFKVAPKSDKSPCTIVQ